MAEMGRKGGQDRWEAETRKADEGTPEGYCVKCGEGAMEQGERCQILDFTDDVGWRKNGPEENVA